LDGVVVATPTTILSNIDASNGGISQQIRFIAEDDQYFRAVPFTMPNEPYSLTSVRLLISGFPDETGDPVVSIMKSDAGSNRPGSLFSTLVGSLEAPPSGTTSQLFSAVDTVLLEADQTYWLQVSQGSPGRFGWVYPTDPFNPVNHPTGVASLASDGIFVASIRPVGDNYWFSTDWWNQFSIDGAVVPEPESLSLLLVANALLIRRRRVR
jgi:hypothetical protein